jgi:hypothetical protein
MILTKTRTKPVNTGQRIFIPAWLSNPDLPAPCICGQPLMPGQPHLIGEGETGMKRWFHMSCFHMMQDIDEDDWEDWDDE